MGGEWRDARDAHHAAGRAVFVECVQDGGGQCVGHDGGDGGNQAVHNDQAHGHPVGHRLVLLTAPQVAQASEEAPCPPVEGDGDEGDEYDGRAGGGWGVGVEGA